MRAAVCLALAVAGCGAPSFELRYRPGYVDPTLGDAPAEALQAWQTATDGRFPERAINFMVAPLEGCAGLTDATNDFAQPAFVTVIPGLSPAMLRRVLLHELGHVARLQLDPDSGDWIHYHGNSPSVMRTRVEDCADEIGAPELAAFERKFPR